MMSAPLARTASGFIALTVAAVPTGMNAGVRTSPRHMRIRPVRAAPSVAERVKAKRVTGVALASPSPSGEGLGWGLWAARRAVTSPTPSPSPEGEGGSLAQPPAGAEDEHDHRDAEHLERDGEAERDPDRHV